MHPRRAAGLAFLIAIAVWTLPILAQPSNYRAHLSGDSEVPPAETNAQGEVIFQLSADSTELYYRLNVANIEDVRAAHIHLAPEDVNGPVVVTLYGGPAIPGRFQGTLAEGTITAANLSGPLTGMSLAALIAAIEDGQAYVNVHTDQYPGGEIRGQVF